MHPQEQVMPTGDSVIIYVQTTTGGTVPEYTIVGAPLIAVPMPAPSLKQVLEEDWDEEEEDNSCDECSYDPCECSQQCGEHEACSCGWCESSGCPVCCGCCGCGYYDDGEGYSEACERWGLPERVNLVPLAADFYLLYELSLDNMDDGRFQAWLDDNLSLFVNYTDMVVGGELRHASGILDDDEQTPLTKAIKSTFRRSERGEAWLAWYDFRKEHGKQALEWATNIFNTFTAGKSGDYGYGGPKWASISDALLMLEAGTISPVAFVDMCWGLEHNGGCYFSKLPWQAEVQEVLDANLRGRTDTVLEYATEDVRKLYETEVESSV